MRTIFGVTMGAVLVLAGVAVAFTAPGAASIKGGCAGTTCVANYGCDDNDGDECANKSQAECENYFYTTSDPANPNYGCEGDPYQYNCEMPAQSLKRCWTMYRCEWVDGIGCKPSDTVYAYDDAFYGCREL